MPNSSPRSSTVDTAPDRRLTRAAGAGAVHRELADALEEGGRQLALDPGRGEVLRLRDEGDLAVQHRRAGRRSRRRRGGCSPGSPGPPRGCSPSPPPRGGRQAVSEPPIDDLHRAVEQPGPPVCDVTTLTRRGPASGPGTEPSGLPGAGWAAYGEVPVRRARVPTHPRTSGPLHANRRPTVPLLPGAEPYRHDGGRGRRPALPRVHRLTAVACVPGREYLAGRGLTVSLPLLPGHGTRWQDMQITGWQDWYAEVDRELRSLSERLLAGLRLRAVDGRRARPAAGRPARRRRSAGSSWSTRRSRRDGLGVKALPVLRHLVPSVPGHRQRHRQGRRRTRSATTAPRCTPSTR